MTKPDEKLFSFAEHLVHCYAKFDQLSNYYQLQIDDIAEFDLDKLISLYLEENPEYLSEATGPDNPCFPEMSFYMLELFSNSVDEDKRKDFLDKFQEGIRKYCSKSLQKLIDDYVYEYNDMHGYTGLEDTGSKRYFGDDRNIYA